MMNNYVLNFDNYCWMGNESTAPECGGIYCVFSCNRAGSQLLVDELLYIGQTANFRRRFEEHTASGRFSPETAAGKVVFFAYALLDGRSLNACEAALVYHFQPRYNESLRESFSGHDVTTVSAGGRWAFRIAGSFVQNPT